MNVVHERYMTEEERFGLHFFFPMTLVDTSDYIG